MSQLNYIILLAYTCKYMLTVYQGLLLRETESFLSDCCFGSMPELKARISSFVLIFVMVKGSYADEILRIVAVKFYMYDVRSISVLSHINMVSYAGSLE